MKSLRGATRKGRAEMDIGVRRSFEEMGQLLTNGVSSIEFIVPGQKGKKGHSRMTAKFDHQVWERMGDQKDAATKHITLDGRLEMADFKLGDLKCIIHTSDNQRITCSFPTEIEDEVYKALRHVTRVSGTATLDLKTRRPEQMALSSVAVLDPHLGQAADFFSSRSIQQLTQTQGTDPKFDLRTVENGWPEGEDVDAFLAAIEEVRSA